MHTIMPTFVVRTDVPEITSALKRALQQLGYTETTSFPADFVFFGGGGIVGRYAELPDTKQSTWVSLLYGKAKDFLTNKVTLSTSLHASFIPPSVRVPEVPVIRSLYILKPETGFQGKGITVVSSRKEAEDWIESHPEHSDWILQKYLRNPDTYKGYKFHMRVLVCVVVRRGQRKVYVCNRHRMILAKKPYKEDDWLNPDIHDTHAKSNPEIVYFPDVLPDGWTDTDKTQHRIESIVHTLWDSVSTLPLRADLYGKQGFEVFGADILFQDKKPYLLEFNKKVALFASQSDVYATLPALILQGSPGPYWVEIL